MAHLEVHGGNFQLVAHFPLLTLMFLIGGALRGSFSCQYGHTLNPKP